MKGIKAQSLCFVFVFLFCLTLNSCKISENILQGTSEVDFSIPQKLQISFNEHIYDTTIVYNNYELEMNFSDEEDLLDGAFVSLTDRDYKITYKDMAFKGNSSELSHSFLPCVIYNFLLSFDDEIILDSYDKKRECHYVKKEINGYFIVLECYEKENNKAYSMEIK